MGAADILGRTLGYNGSSIRNVMLLYTVVSGMALLPLDKWLASVGHH